MQRIAADNASAAARFAGLRYVSDEIPGIQRIRRGGGFAYIGPGGRAIRDARTLARIKSLAIPPAWHDVWICPEPSGHLQATGRDGRNRKQHCYHPRWREVRDATKYHKVIDFAKALPAIHRATERHLRLAGLPREKVLGAVVRILEKTLIRVGNEQYVRENHHFGLTTLRNRHAKVRGGQVHFEFKGKGGIDRAVDLRDRRLAHIVQDCQELPGQELFQYIDESGLRHGVSSHEVNDYLRQISGDDFTAKDFRTWAGTVMAARALQDVHKLQPAKSKKQAKSNILRAIEAVARQLGNTRAICRKCYIHPAILECYLNGSLIDVLEKCDLKVSSAARPDKGQLALLELLENRSDAARARAAA